MFPLIFQVGFVVLILLVVLVVSLISTARENAADKRRQKEIKKERLERAARQREREQEEKRKAEERARAATEGYTYYFSEEDLNTPHPEKLNEWFTKISADNNLKYCFQAEVVPNFRAEGLRKYDIILYDEMLDIVGSGTFVLGTNTVITCYGDEKRSNLLIINTVPYIFADKGVYINKVADGQA